MWEVDLGHKQYISRVKIKPWVPGKTFPGDVVSYSTSEVGMWYLVLDQRLANYNL